MRWGRLRAKKLLPFKNQHSLSFKTRDLLSKPRVYLTRQNIISTLTFFQWWHTKTFRYTFRRMKNNKFPLEKKNRKTSYLFHNINIILINGITLNMMQICSYLVIALFSFLFPQIYWQLKSQGSPLLMLNGVLSVYSTLFPMEIMITGESLNQLKPSL